MIALDAEIDRRIAFALQQNDVPVVKSVRVHNTSDAPLADLTLRITAEPAFAAAWELPIDAIAPGATHRLDAVPLSLSPGFLAASTGRARGELRISVTRGDACLVERVEPVEVLARDEWGGLGSLPEILAAFVMPNHPAVDSILRRAADTLGGWSADPSLQGYQTKDPARALAMAAAVYAALQAVGITYVSPPASFAAEGQRIRLPDRIVAPRLGTCLDLAVLGAACLEQAGLHPLIVIVEGHAFCGVWLVEECFAEPVIDDVLRLRKRVDLGEIAVFDPTLVTARPAQDWSAAQREARRRLDSDRPEAFHCAIDVQRARRGGIRPMPEQTAGPVVEAREDAGATGAPSLALPVAPLRLPDAAETPATRLDRWQRHLLDLTLHNRLVNFRETKKTLRLLCPDVAALEDALSEEAAFRILPRPRDFGAVDPRDAEAHRRRTGAEANAELLQRELRAHRLYADLADDELDARLLEIYRAARTGLEEGGASALYLAIGFLQWYETPQSAQRRLAPILLLPLELSRPSAREGFSVRRTDEEPRLNVTLLELLKRDFDIDVTGLDAVAEDEAGLDVARLLQTVRHRIRDVERWDVVDEARIGIFSFAKFLMWRDLAERAGDLVANPLVDHLVNRPHEPFEPGATFPDADTLDETRPPRETFCPLPADASQLAAVFAAADGRTFVLEGPPGTGKSQTIANLVAHALALGKTVLFVSEKMAALSVVHERLRDIGLGRHCLELHSNTAQKAAVIARLDEALADRAPRTTDEWEQVARRLETLRGELNAYVHALHRPRGSGETVFQVTSRLAGLRDAPRVELAWASVDDVDAGRLAELRERVDRLAATSADIDGLADHPWRAVRRTDWTPVWEQSVAAAIARLRTAVDALDARVRSIVPHVLPDAVAPSRAALSLLDQVAGALLDAPVIAADLVVDGDDDLDARIGEWIARGRRRDALRAQVLARFTDGVLALDLDGLRRELASAEGSSWPFSWWRRRRVARALAAVAQPGQAPAAPELAPALSRAIELRTETRAIEAAAGEASAMLGAAWRHGEADWDLIAAQCAWARNVRSLALRLTGADLDCAGALRARWARLVTEGRALLKPDAVLGADLLAYRAAHRAFVDAMAEVDRLLAPDAGLAWGAPEAAGALETARRTLAAWASSVPRLREWCVWQRVRTDAASVGLARLVEAHESGAVAREDLRRAFEHGFARWWRDEVVSAEPALSAFWSPEHERRIDQFREVDDRYTALTGQLVAARLAARVPAPSLGELAGSEVGVLKREVGKRRRHLPVRQLFRAMPNLLPRLAPCLLMSPMSVAQFLDPRHPPFDLVVFDEASQIPVWDAVGAIARGRQAVVVGDPRQLPPTSFFQRTENADEEPDPDVVEDLESILDDCLSAGVRPLRLDWHYRSRHESLIAFSNHHYYANRLLTFPSPHRAGMGVAWRHVPGGVYDRGRSATNRREAEAVVAEIVRRLRDPALRAHSIGVVTFSQAQQGLIEDLLEAVRRTDASVDAFFAEDRKDPVFVKNLESVQGDERDVILFSVGYGPDATGRVALNFGPMNREGGERRLNVAITRARREVLVFSTLRAEQIDLARSRARGVRDLKSFLEYAEHGVSALAATRSHDPDAAHESPFEAQVHAALARKGWEVHPQVGCARYRIDLAVVDPDAPGRYLLGIECDGANYHRAKSARDRDKLRDRVLRDLGWTLHRIWSSDWWTDPDKVMTRVEAVLAAARRAPAEAPVVSPSTAPETPIAPIASAPEVAIYAPLPLQPAPRGAFYDASQDGAIAGLLVRVVEHEGPIRLELAARRLAACFGLDRVRSAAVDRVRALIPRDRVRVDEAEPDAVFLWPIAVDPEAYDGFRAAGADPGSMRDAADLPLREVANAALAIARQQIAAPEAALTAETARLLGYRRTGRLIEDRVRLAIDDLERRGAVRREAGTIVLAGS